MGNTNCRVALEEDILNQHLVWILKIPIYLIILLLLSYYLISYYPYINQNATNFLLGISPLCLFFYLFVYVYLLRYFLLEPNSVSNAKLVECLRWQNANEMNCEHKIKGKCVIPDNFSVF